MPEIIEQHDPQENVDSTLRRSTRERKSTILSDYVVYLQKSDFNVGAKMILKPFVSHELQIIRFMVQHEG